MLKVVTIVCLCTLMLVEAQHDPPKGGPPHHGHSEHGSRSTRQAHPQGNGPIPQGMNGGMGQGNMGMQGLGNIPDPTVWIAKGQEILSQFARGRREVPQ